MKRLVLLVSILFAFANAAEAQMTFRQSTADQIEILGATILGSLYTSTGALPANITVSVTKHRVPPGAPAFTSWTPTTFGTGTHDIYVSAAGKNTWTTELTATDLDTTGPTEVCLDIISQSVHWCEHVMVAAQASWDVNFAGSVASSSDVTAIKAQTDKLTYTGSNEVSSNVTVMAANVITAAATAASAFGSSEIPLLANLDTTVSTRGSYIFKAGVNKQISLSFKIAGVPVTAASAVTCKIAKDGPISSASGASFNTASATSDYGSSELTLSGANDLTGVTDYLNYHCTAGGAVVDATLYVQQ